MMIVMGNGSSFLGRYMGGIYLPVANTIGINTSWNFFSPDPAHVMYFKYVVHFNDEYGNPVKEPLELYYPEDKDQSEFALHLRRHSYMMRFMALDFARIRDFFIPWVCRKYPEATSVDYTLILHNIPPLDKVLTLKETEYSDLVTSQELNQQIFLCGHYEKN